MKTQAIRDAFCQFFASKQHTNVASASLVPENDPTLLFVNAGMVPFKNVFLGQEKRDYTRATSIQTCVRAGGKHNDLENVGYTARHHTFFEMLGNFSFGDYFKREAISYAWEFLTEVLNIPKEKLWITVFEEDQEAEDIWLKEIGVDSKRFSRIGAKDNFWAMGDTGPCGPCTEIFYDHGESVAGGPPGSPEEDGDRYIEIWNLVFMQYDRQADGTLKPLPKPSVDTGMGLERIAAVMQNVHENYEIDLFQYLIQAVGSIVGKKDDWLHNKSARVIADHIRACAFLIKDGVYPSNEGRGYVLRRIIRRAIRHGHQLGIKDIFFYKMVQPLINVMGQAYPDLKAKQSDIENALQKEEQQFVKTLDQGLVILEKALKDHQKGDLLSGEVAFQLYDTYGFPIDLTHDILRERGLEIDMPGFEKAMQAQKDRAREGGKFEANFIQKIRLDHDTQTQFVGYDTRQQKTEVTHLFNDKAESVGFLEAGEQGAVVLPITPFYAESGGQTGDNGLIQFDGGHFEVLDTQKIGQSIIHQGVMIEGELKAGMQVTAVVDQAKHEAIMRHHSVTHVLHAALRNILGEHVTQKGSLVAADRLRFDFSQPEGLTDQQLIDIERLVNQEIQANHIVEIAETDMDSAKQMGAMALFGEKYGASVRVLKMGDFSIELCGGTHVARTGDIGYFKILFETGIASGVRRIEAVAGMVAVEAAQAEHHVLVHCTQSLKTKPEQLTDKLSQLLAEQKQLQKQITDLQSQLAGNQSDDLLSKVIDVNGMKLLSAEVQGIPTKAMRDLLDELKAKMDSGVIVLGLKNDDKVNLIAGVADSLTHQIRAGELVNFVAQQVGGKGGGRADMAQAGGTQSEHLDAALASVRNWLAQKLS